MFNSTQTDKLKNRGWGGLLQLWRAARLSVEILLWVKKELFPISKLALLHKNMNKTLKQSTYELIYQQLENKKKR